MAKRPFIQKGIDELELLLKSSGSDPLTLTALQEELIHRSMPRAVQLLKTVRKALALPQFANSISKPTLFDQPRITRSAADPAQVAFPGLVSIPRATELPLPAPIIQGPSSPPHAIPRLEPLPFLTPAEPSNRTDDGTMSPEEACKVLQVTLGANWELIEKARREIVQKSHPARVRTLAPERRRALIEQAQRANEASQALLAMKVAAENPSGSHHPEAIDPAPEGVAIPIQPRRN